MASKNMASKQKNFNSGTTRPPLKVLVTGATGFLGRHLVPALLTKGFSVTCLVRSDPGPGLWADCTMVFGDIRDHKAVAQAVTGQDAVIHAAAVVNPKSAGEYQSINVEGTRQLVESAKQSHVNHFIFISSVDVGHKTAYGVSKEKGEELVKDSGIHFTILRPGPIYGPDDNKNIMELFDLVSTKRLIPVIGDGNYLRQPIHVDDACASIISVINSPKSIGKIYYLGGPSITYNEILAAMVDASGNRPTVVHLPPGLAKVFVMAINKFGLGPNVTRDQLQTIDHDKIGDVHQFQQDFGIQARPFKEGLHQVVTQLHDPQAVLPGQISKASHSKKKKIYDTKKSKKTNYTKKSLQRKEGRRKTGNQKEGHQP